MDKLNPEIIQSPFLTATKEIKASKAYNEYLDVIKSQGFSSAEQWGQIGDRIYRAFAAIKLEKDMPSDMDQQMAKAMAQMKSSGISSEQQQMMMDMMSASQQALKQFENVPQADKDAVRPHMKAIEQLN